MKSSNTSLTRTGINTTSGRPSGRTCVVIFNPDWDDIFDAVGVSDETVQNVVIRCHKYESVIILAELYDHTDLLISRPDG
jgi:hypothetical protein